MKKALKEGLKWEDFQDPETDAIEKEYLPRSGEGDNMATQAVTATVKLIYKWFNDGDVYDNTAILKGWWNDLTSYANWLYEYIPETEYILKRIWKIGSRDEYSQLLYDLMHTVLTRDFVRKYEQVSATGTIYECEGPFRFENEEDYEEEDDWGYEEDDEYEY